MIFGLEKFDIVTYFTYLMQIKWMYLLIQYIPLNIDLVMKTKFG